VEAAVSPLPDDIEALKALTLQRADEAEAKLANARARESATEAMIAHLKLQIAKLRREQYGASAERTERLLAQMKLQLEDLEADAAEDGLAAEAAAAKTSVVTAFKRKRPTRKPFPEHLPRERVVIPAPCSCPACGSALLSKLGEDSRDRRGDHPQMHLASRSGFLQADAYGGYGELYREGRAPTPILEAGCFAHARRKFFELADVAGAARRKSRGERTGMIYPIALEAVQRLDALFDIERTINGKPAAERLAVRQELSAPLMVELHVWLTTQVAKLSRNHDLAKTINYMLRRWDAFTRFLDDGRICITNNAAERALRCVPFGRKAWLFCGSDHGGQRAAIIYTLIQTAKLNDVDPQA